MACTGAVLRDLERLVEALARHAEHDPAEHLDEAPIRVPAEALVVRERDQPLQRRVVEAEIEDGVHHPRHRKLRARAHAHEQRILGGAEALVALALERGDRGGHVVEQTFGQALAVREVVVAGFGRDRETGRHAEPGFRHFGESGAFAAEKIAHRPVAVGLSVAPRVEVAFRRAVRAADERRRRRLSHDPISVSASNGCLRFYVTRRDAKKLRSLIGACAGFVPRGDIGAPARPAVASARK